MSSPDTSQPHDDTFREALRANLVAPPSQAEQTKIDALQSRILAEWSARQPVSFGINIGASRGTTGFMARILGQVGPHRQLQWGFIALALMVLMAVQITQSGHEPNIDDLLEPDVLALMAMGEL